MLAQHVQGSSSEPTYGACRRRQLPTVGLAPASSEQADVLSIITVGIKVESTKCLCTVMLIDPSRTVAHETLEACHLFPKQLFPR